MEDINRNVLPLLTVPEGVFSTGEPSDRFEAVLQAAVHGWMEGHLSAPGHVVRGETTEEMPAPPYPPREGAALKAILHEVMGRFGLGEEPGAALCGRRSVGGQGDRPGSTARAARSRTPTSRSRERFAPDAASTAFI